MTGEIKLTKPTYSTKAFFDVVKNKLTHKKTRLALEHRKFSIKKLIQKAEATGQTKMLAQLQTELAFADKEAQIFTMGINQYINRKDVARYMNQLADVDISFIELADYNKEIPDDIVQVIMDTKDVFDRFFVLYTDYQRKDQQEVARERDPILIGTFYDKAHNYASDQLFYLGDWVDDNCDLTLDGLIDAFKADGKDVVHKLTIKPFDQKELDKLGELKEVWFN